MEAPDLGKPDIRTFLRNLPDSPALHRLYFFRDEPSKFRRDDPLVRVGPPEKPGKHSGDLHDGHGVLACEC